VEALTWAWRNLWRNRRRTAITIAAVTANATVLIVLSCINDGVIGNGIRNVTGLVVGDAQIHAPGYRATRSIYETIDKPKEIIDKARSKGIKAVPRSLGAGLIALGTKSAGAIIWGVDAAAERDTFALATKISAGRYLNGKTKSEVVLGYRLARSLNAKVGAEVVLLVQAFDGSMGNELFTVVGLMSEVGENVDRSAVFMNRVDYDTLFVSKEKVHQIAFRGPRNQPLERTMAQLKPMVGKAELKSWKGLLPSFADMVGMNANVSMLFGFIFALAAGLGVMNTMLMATYDRVREFGVIRALGGSSRRILIGITTEAMLLAFVSSVFAAILGTLGAWYLQEVGIDLTAIAGGGVHISGVVMDAVLRAELSVGNVVFSCVLMSIVCPIASLYPAFKAARLDPVIAMNHG